MFLLSQSELLYCLLNMNIYLALLNHTVLAVSYEWTDLRDGLGGAS